MFKVELEKELVSLLKTMTRRIKELEKDKDVLYILVQDLAEEVYNDPKKRNT